MHCTDCGVRFDKPSEYLIHRRKKHPKFSCSDCGKVFGFRKKLAYHLKGCSETRRNKMRRESDTVVSFSDYKHLPIVTAKELDIEFEIYMNRKFGKKSIFRNKKMCKFCCETFVMASDFADHIRDHYESIPLDAAGVKSKFDFMHFMGLKIRETNDTDFSDTETMDKLKNKMAECRVVIVGERCDICHEVFKCRTDLDQHNKAHHRRKNRNKILLILKIGKEIISKISLKKRHIRSGHKTSHRSPCEKTKIGLNQIYKNLEYSLSTEKKDRTAKPLRSVGKSVSNNSRAYDVGIVYEFMGEEEDEVKSAIPLKKNARRAIPLRNEINQTKSNVIRWSQGARGRKEIVLQRHEELDTAGKTEDGLGLEDSNCDKTEVRNFELETENIYADEFFERIQLSEPWKDEFTKNNGSWYSEMESEENVIASDEEKCYCLGMTGPRLTPKRRNTWDEEHYNNKINGDETGSCNEISLHESPPIYKYSCDQKYQADFSFPSDEKSYGFEVQHGKENEESNNNESSPLDYRGGIVIRDEGSNLTLNHLRSGTQIDKYQRVIIKEEVMLDDCTCCINDIYPF